MEKDYWVLFYTKGVKSWGIYDDPELVCISNDKAKLEEHILFLKEKVDAICKLGDEFNDKIRQVPELNKPYPKSPYLKKGFSVFFKDRELNKAKLDSWNKTCEIFKKEYEKKFALYAPNIAKEIMGQNIELCKKYNIIDMLSDDGEKYIGAHFFILQTKCI